MVCINVLRNGLVQKFSNHLYINFFNLKKKFFFHYYFNSSSASIFFYSTKTRQRKGKRHFDEIYADERLQDPESLFKVNIFYRVLGIIINQLRSRFV